jgi:hypothetical protein
MTAQPTHVDLFSITNELCVCTITEVEGGLVGQRMAEAVEAIRHQEEEMAKAEMARIAAEHEEHEKQERLKKLEQDRLDIEAAEHELEMHKQALHNAQKGSDPHDDDNDDDDDDNGSVSVPEGHPVRHSLIYSAHSLLTMTSNISGNYQGQDEASAG